MLDINRYIENGKVKRDRIVTDIIMGEIDESDIIELDKNEKISKAYFGTGRFEKLDKNEWDRKYLDKLSLASVSESFNKEYLLYLNEVARFVMKNKINERANNKMPKGSGVAVIILCIVFFIFYIASKIR